MKCKIHGITMDHAECYACDGEGEIEETSLIDEWHNRTRVKKCHQCLGSGYSAFFICEFCEEGLSVGRDEREDGELDEDE